MVVSIKNLFVYSSADCVAAVTKLSIKVSSSEISTFKNNFAFAVDITGVVAATSTLNALIPILGCSSKFIYIFYSLFKKKGVMVIPPPLFSINNLN